MKLNKIKKFLRIGSRVRTVWDDSDKSIWAVVIGWYRGHRDLMLQVRMPDNTIEVVGGDQVKGFIH